MIAWNTVISAGFNEPYNRVLELAYSKIAAVKTPEDWRAPGMPADAVPAKVTFGFSPPNGKGHKLITGRNVRQMTAHNLSVDLDVYVDTLGISRKDWQQDVKGLLRKVPRDLRRTADKNPDVLLAALLRNGKTGTDYRGEAFFATSKDSEASTRMGPRGDRRRGSGRRGRRRIRSVRRGSDDGPQQLAVALSAGGGGRGHHVDPHRG